MKYDTRQIGIKSPDGLLVEKCKINPIRGCCFPVDFLQEADHLVGIRSTHCSFHPHRYPHGVRVQTVKCC